MAGQAIAVAKVLVKYAPKVFPYAVQAVQFLINNPAVPAWARTKIADVALKIRANSKRRGADKIRGMTEMVRSVALDTRSHDAEALGAEADRWIRQADSIDLRTRIAKALPRREQKKHLSTIEIETEALLAEVIESLANVRTIAPRAQDS